MTDPAHDYAKQIADELREIAQVDTDAYNDAPELGMQWLSDQLDVWTVLEWRQPQWEQPRVTMSEVRTLRTCNGPHCEVVYSGRDETLTVEVWWGSDHAVVQVECPPVAHAMDAVWDSVTVPEVAQ